MEIDLFFAHDQYYTYIHTHVYMAKWVKANGLKEKTIRKIINKDFSIMFVRINLCSLK